jgi:hypothetical protein
VSPVNRANRRCCFIDRLVEFDSPRGRGDGDEDNDKQAKRREWRQESQRHPPLIEAHCGNAERLQFIDD